MSALDTELNRIIAARNTFTAVTPADLAAAEQRFLQLAVEAVHRTGQAVRSDLDTYEAMLDNRAARLAGLGYGDPPRPPDVAAVVVLPAPPIPPVLIADVVLTVLALLIAAIASNSGSEVPGSAPAGRPVYEKGALGDRYEPGVHDPDELFTEDERKVADRILEVDPGARIDPRPADHTTQGQQNPDAILRRSSAEPGTIIEIKTLKTRGSDMSNTVNQAIADARKQLRPHGGGDVYIDGREIGLTADEAERGYRRAAGNAGTHASEMPGAIAILGDGTLHELGKK